jgi:hypothetical protein
LQKLPQNCRKKNRNMATLSYEIGKPKQDGTRKVSVLLSHKGKRKRIPTSIIVDSKDISRSGNISSRRIQKVIDDKINELKDKLYDLEIDLIDKDVDVDWIYGRLLKKTESVDFFSFARNWINNSNIKGKKNYTTMLNSLEKYTHNRTLPFSHIDYGFLEGFKRFLKDHPRAQSLYLGEIRHLYNEATKEYNTQYEKVIPSSPFEFFKIPKHTPQTNNRVISEENLVKIFNYQGTRRVGLARDCYILSFCLMGMNSIDLYECASYHNGVLSYDRAKTKDRRADNAHIEVIVPAIITPLLKKYKGIARVFDFYKRYTNASNFNKHINIGLHAIAKELGIPSFDFYSARHTWASIARNKLGIDKYTIHEALNHVSDLDVTDIYIQKDYSNINKANAKVVEYLMSLINNTQKG